MPSNSKYASDQAQSKQTVPAIAKLLSSDKTVLIVVLFVTALAISLGALAENRALFDSDEEIYLRVIKIFDRGWSLELLRSYQGEPASPAPIFFIIYAWWGKIFGFSYQVFRGLSLVLTLLTMLCLSVFLRKQAQNQRVFFPLLLFLFPYIFSMGFSVMAEPLTLLFTVVGICCYLYGLENKSDVALLLGSIAITAALYVRIHAVFASVALGIVMLLQKDRSVLRWCIVAAPILARLPLIFIQGGLTVSREAFTHTKPELGFCLSNINFFCVWFGYLFFPLLWSCRGRRSVNITATVALIPFYVLATPNFLGTEHNGALRSLFVQLGLTLTTTQWILFPIWLLGCYMTIDLIQRIVMVENYRDVFLSSCIVLFMASLVFSTVAFERYYQLAVGAIVLLGFPKSTPSRGFFAVGALHVFFLLMSVARLLSDVR